MRIHYCLLLLLILSCKNKPANTIVSSSVAKKSHTMADSAVLKNKSEPVEHFVDSTDVGKKSHNKFELSEYVLPDTSYYVVIKFYSRHNNKWQKRNEYHFPKDGFSECDPKTSDFNNDGLNDVTYISGIAARGANEIRTLFIYDEKNDSLVYIKNSSSYPNLLYNKQLNCLDAFLVSGCAATVFLKIEKDTLREFASVDQCDSLIVSTYDKTGKEKVILRKNGGRGDFTRYKNYRPLQVNNDE